MVLNLNILLLFGIFGIPLPLLLLIDLNSDYRFSFPFVYSNVVVAFVVCQYEINRVWLLNESSKIYGSFIGVYTIPNSLFHLCGDYVDALHNMGMNRT